MLAGFRGFPRVLPAPEPARVGRRNASNRPPGSAFLMPCSPVRQRRPRIGLRFAIPLQEVEAARQCCLVDGERVLELPQVRLSDARDGRKNLRSSPVAPSR